MPFGGTRAQDLAGRAPHRARIGTVALVRGLAARGLEYLQFKLVRIRERHRMNRVRRDPAALMVRLTFARHILIVCYGNIIRSPFTAGLLSRALGERTTVSIASGGLCAVPGTPAHARAVRAAAKYGVNLGEHVAATVTPEAVAAADVILLMDTAQLAVMRRRFPQARAKTFLVTSLAPDTPLEISDPVDGDESVFHACFEHISSAVRPIVHMLSTPVHQ